VNQRGKIVPLDYLGVDLELYQTAATSTLSSRLEQLGLEACVLIRVGAGEVGGGGAWATMHQRVELGQ